MPESFQLAEREASLLFSPKERKIFKTNNSRNPYLRVFVKVGLLAPLLLRISQFLRRPMQMTYQIIFLLVYQQNCLQEVVCPLPQYFITARIFISIFTRKNIAINSK